MPRQKTLDEQKKTEICAMLTAGMSLTRVARRVGCDRRSIHRERERDPAFGERVRQARMAAELHPHAAMRRFATQHWRAAAWLIDREDRREEERRARKYYSQKDLDNLAAWVKRILDLNIVFDPIDGPPIADQVDDLFRQAEPGKTEPPPRDPGRNWPTVGESIRFLEKRFAERAAAAQEEKPDGQRPEASPGRNGRADQEQAPPAVRTGDTPVPPMSSAPARDGQSDDAPARDASVPPPTPNVPAPGTNAAPSESQQTLPTPSPTTTRDASANVPGNRVPGSGAGRPTDNRRPPASPGPFPPTRDAQRPTAGDKSPHRRAERDAKRPTNTESNGRVRRE